MDILLSPARRKAKDLERDLGFVMKMENLVVNPVTAERLTSKRFRHIAFPDAGEGIGLMKPAVSEQPED